MLTDLQKAVADAGYGIEIKTIGIKQLKVSADVSKKVFERMKADRNERAVTITTKGDAEAVSIKSRARSMSDELTSVAEARAKKIMGQGDAEAAKYYKMLEANPDLAIFLRDLEALQKMLEARTTLLIPADYEPFSLLKGLKGLHVLEPNKPADVSRASRP
jgi:membrane protease subunit HflC